MGPTHVVYKKSEHARWRTPGHKGPVSCMYVRGLTGRSGGGTLPRVFTGGVDGVVKIHDGKDGRILYKIKAFDRPVTAITVGGGEVFAASESGEVLRLDLDVQPVEKWQAHHCPISHLQVVSGGKIFTSGTDGTVKLFSLADKQVQRQYIPPTPEPVLKFQVCCNLLFTSSPSGTIRVFTLDQQLIKVLRTSALENKPLVHMQILCSDDRISIFCGTGNQLVMWYLTVDTTMSVENMITIDAVKALSNRIEGGTITGMAAVLVNPLYQKQPLVYLSTSAGYIHLYVPTTKEKSVIKMGPSGLKYKFYTFKDAHTKITSIGCGSGRVYGGTTSGTVLMWKEPLNMLRVRAMCAKQNDGHTFGANNQVQSVPEPNWDQISAYLPDNSNVDIDTAFSKLGLADSQEQMLNVVITL